MHDWSLVRLLLVVAFLGYGGQAKPVRDANYGIAQAIVHQFDEVFDSGDPWSRLLLLDDPRTPFYSTWRPADVRLQSSILVHFALWLEIKGAGGPAMCQAYGAAVNDAQVRLAARSDTKDILGGVAHWSTEEATALCNAIAPPPLEGKRRAVLVSLRKVAQSIAAEAQPWWTQ